MTQRRGPSTNAGTQCCRLLAWARAGHVIHQDDWYSRGADGGPPVKAVRSRISSLKAEGYGFHHRMRSDRTMEYSLAYVPPEVEPRVDTADLGEPPKEPGEPTPAVTSTRSDASDDCRHGMPGDIAEPRLFEPAPTAPRSAVRAGCEISCSG